MKNSKNSPSGHVYSLSQIKGKRAAMIRELNLRALPKFEPHDIQIVSWSLQAGLSYGEMTKESQKIIDEVIPQFKPDLGESFISVMEKKWDQASSLSGGLLPSLKNSSESLLSELGEVGQKINELRQFKTFLNEVGHDYSSLSGLIDTFSKPKSKNKPETLWSHISDNVYARFVTEGHFQEIGFVQVRIVSGKKGKGQKREVNSVINNKVAFDLASLIANPGTDSIQPLTFSPLYGYAGVLVFSTLARTPMAATLLLAAVLTAKTIDWDAFFGLYDLLRDVDHPGVQKELEKGSHALQEAHDKLEEKSIKDYEIIDEKTEDTSTGKDKSVREYTKSGGEEQLQKDFDKLPGELKTAEDGIEYKEMPDGTRMVKRPRTDDASPTLEVQPTKNDSEIHKRLRIKVRYL